MGAVATAIKWAFILGPDLKACLASAVATAPVLYRVASLRLGVLALILGARLEWTASDRILRDEVSMLFS